MTPIVFWPSEVPCARATIEAVNACPYLKPVSLCLLRVGRVIRYASAVAAAAARPATTGATMAGSSTLDTITE